MNIKLSFLGAAGNVTGSSYLLEMNERRILIDCGFFQEWKFKHRNRDAFLVDPSTIDAVLLTHAHLDHCGLVPKLVRDGFTGPIHCTKATAKIAAIIMLDSGRLQEEDADYKSRRHQKKNPDAPVISPIYNLEDAKNAVPLLHPTPMVEPLALGEGISARFYESGHILGACSIELTITQADEKRTIIFSGDIGRWDAPILRNPHLFEKADYVIMESTYGNRDHEPAADVDGQLERVIHQTFEAGGNVIIPAFAVERSQDLLYHLSLLLKAKKIPPMLVFVDSPMAIRVTDVFKQNHELFDAETQELLESGGHPCDFPGLIMSRTVDQSKGINQIHGSCIVIAGSGMCTGGRIKHHLKNNIGGKENTILFVGYQADGTLGRQLIEGAKEVRLFGELREVKARVDKINGFSGHADRTELAKWIGGFTEAPRKVFVTHGEKRAAAAWKTYLEEELGYEAMCPEYQQTVELD